MFWELLQIKHALKIFSGLVEVKRRAKQRLFSVLCFVYGQERKAAQRDMSHAKNAKKARATATLKYENARKHYDLKMYHDHKFQRINYSSAFTSFKIGHMCSHCYWPCSSATPPRVEPTSSSSA